MIADRYEMNRPEFLKMLEEFEDMWDSSVGRIKPSRLQIELAPDKFRPVHSAHYQTGPTASEFAADKMDRILKKHHLTRHNRMGMLNRLCPEKEWVAPRLCRPSKTKCCNCQRILFASTNGRVHRLLGRSAHLCNLICKLGLLAVEIDEWDRKKTVFTSHHDLFQIVRMLFALENAFVTFRRAMGVIPFSVKWQSALVYLDVIVVFSKTVKQHFNHLQRALVLLCYAGEHFYWKSVKGYLRTSTALVKWSAMTNLR